MRRLAALASLLLSPVAFASGQLDSRFDDDGVLLTQIAIEDLFFGDEDLRAGIVDRTGRYVGAGYAIAGDGRKGSVVRVLSDGTLDATFGNGGIVRVAPFAGYDQLVWSAVAEQADGKLVLAGYIGINGINLGDSSRAYVCRLQPNGSPDPGFGTGGCTAPAFWPESSNDKVLQADGRIVLLGTTVVNGVNHDYLVARLDTDGSYDACFGDVTCEDGGLLIQPEPPADLPAVDAYALALAPDGRIVIAGTAAGMMGTGDMVAIRLLPTGDVDVGFGNGGHRLVAFNQGGTNADIATAVTVDGNNDIILAGTVRTQFNTLIGIARMDANGNPAAGFGNGGRVVEFFDDVSERHLAARVLLQQDGKLLVSGHTDEAGNGPAFGNCGILRLRSDGQLDPIFGISGKLIIDGGVDFVDPQPDACGGLAIDARSIVLFGEHYVESMDQNLSMLIRLGQDDVFIDGFED
jgi:uncharacterized delta-60 repeat protein